MNIFENRSSIVGSLEPERISDSLKNLFTLAKEIRIKLGKQGYLIDNYLSLVLEAANSTLAYEAAEQGFESGSELQDLCNDILNGADNKKEHTFYQIVKESFANKKYDFQESITLINLHSVSLADAFLEYATQALQLEQESILDSMDDIKLRELYNKIILAVDEKLMEQLNNALKERFFITPVITVFMQGLTNDLLYSLTYRDNETGRQIFQLIMDDL